jgi:hypothetical protein
VNRRVDQFDGMKNRPVVPKTSGGCGDLQRAPWVGRGNHIRRERRDVTDFARPELRRRIGLHQVIDAGAAAADVGFGRRQELDAGNSLQQGTRLRAYALPVGKMAGIVIHDTGGQRPPDGPLFTELDEQLGHVAHFLGDGFCTPGPFRIAGEQLAVFLHG